MIRPMREVQVFTFDQNGCSRSAEYAGIIKANANRANAGEIELHATNKTELSQSAIVSATAKIAGNGGDVKIRINWTPTLKILLI
jgi:hypothetical protein